ncbi:unnamed protein product, partial [Phaeothamnion confervicola]
PNRDIAEEIIIPRPLADAWNLWATHEGLESWLTPLARVEGKLGGSYALFFDPADRSDNNTDGCKITAWVPERVLAFEWKGPSWLEVMNSDPYPTWVLLAFEALDPNTTAVHFRHGGWGEGEDWQEARETFRRIWKAVFMKISSPFEDE